MAFPYQVGVSEDGKWNGIDLNYYGDCGCSSNDATILYARGWMDNGEVYISTQHIASLVGIVVSLPRFPSLRSKRFHRLLMSRFVPHKVKRRLFFVRFHITP